MPALPAAPSTAVPPGLSRPRFSAPVMIASGARALTQPPGYRNSAVPRITQPVAGEARLSRISGVLPIAPMNPSRTSMKTLLGEGEFRLKGGAHFRLVSDALKPRGEPGVAMPDLQYGIHPGL